MSATTATAGAAPRQRTRVSAHAKQTTGWTAALIVVVVFSLVPILWIVFLSLKTPASATDGSFIPHHWTLSNYNDIFKLGTFTDALRNSIGIGLISTFLAVIPASSAAYAIARLEFPGKRLILLVSLGVAMFPQISLVGPLYNVWREIGLYDTWPGLIIPYMTFALPLSIYTLSAFFRDIPWELEQAAQGRRRHAIPGVHQGDRAARHARHGDHLHHRLHHLLERLRVRDLADLDIGGADRSRGDFHFPGVSQFTVPYGDIAAAAVVVTIPVMIIVLVFQRRIVAGLTAGAVKG
jgi:trehalose/maltose transport system permease protein